MTHLSQAEMDKQLSSDEIIAQLQAKIAALTAASQRKLTLKVSDKGAVSLYGLGRFPVTLYRTQWERLIGEASHISAFIEANAGLLATKD